MTTQHSTIADHHPGPAILAQRRSASGESDAISLRLLKNSFSGFLGAILLATAGCSTVYDDRYDFKDGWREGEVLEIGSASAIRSPQFSDCRAEAKPEQIAKGKFVLVAFNHMRHVQRRVAPVPTGSDLKRGEMVYVNVNDCDAPLALRMRGTPVTR